jgi:beta-fructofuranosidase
VLKASSQALGHGDHYYTGTYDQSNQSFSARVHGVYDYGSKFYASKSFLDDSPQRPAPRQTLWAWIKYTTSFTSVQRTLSSPSRIACSPCVCSEADDRFAQRGWAGVQSLPRVISLDTDGTLKIAPIPELAALRYAPHMLTAALWH